MGTIFKFKQVLNSIFLKKMNFLKNLTCSSLKNKKIKNAYLGRPNLHLRVGVQLSCMH
jgi:hypothetical protein